MARTAPVPNIPPIPGMCPSIAVMGGGGGGGGGAGGGGGGDGSAGAGGGGSGDGADADGRSAAEGSCDGSSSGSCSRHDPSQSVGHPVDVVTGRMFTNPVTDLALPGPLPFRFTRWYSSALARRDVGMGHGWSHSLAWQLEVRRDHVVLCTADARAFDLTPIDPGESTLRPEGWELRRDATGYVLDTGDGTWRRFEARGTAHLFELVSVYDAFGNTIALQHDRGLLVGAVDSVGREIAFRRDPGRGSIRALEVKNAHSQGQWVRFAAYDVDVRGDLVEVRDVLSAPNRYEYDDRHLLVLETDAVGTSFHFRYDDDRRCVETWCTAPGLAGALSASAPRTLTDGTPSRGAYHVKLLFGPGNYTEVDDSRRLRRFFGNANGKVDKAVDGPVVTTWTYDAHGHPTSGVDALGRTTTWRRDHRGRLLEQTDAAGGKTSIERDALGHVVRVVDPSGGVVCMSRGPRGEVLERIDPKGGVTAMRYDSRGLVTEQWAPNGGQTRYTYDAHANLTQMVLPNGATYRFDYDWFGRRTSVVDAKQGVRRFVYDDAGRVVRRLQADGAEVKLGYDAVGNLIQSVDPSGNLWRYHHAVTGWIVGIEDPVGAKVGILYDREGDIATIVNENGETQTFERNGRGDVVREVAFDGLERRFRRNAMGFVEAYRDSSGESRDYEYDELDRIVTITYADGAVGARAYDPVGRLTAATLAGSKIELVRDALGDVVTERVTARGVTTEVHLDYDAEGQLVGRRSTRGLDERIRRDAMGARVETLLGGTEQIQHRRDLMGQEIERHLAGGGMLSSRYDERFRLVERAALGSGAAAPAPEDPALFGAMAVGGRRYRYGATGDVTEIATPRGTAYYAHDPVGRLREATLPTTPTNEYRYDPAGNIPESGPSAPGRRFSKGNRLAGLGPIEYRHDAAGRVVERIEHGADQERITRYGWSARGWLDVVSLPDGRRVEFDYDPLARRTEKRVYAADSSGRRALEARTRWVWDGDVIAHELRELHGAGADPIVEERTYVFDDTPFVPLAEQRPAGWAHYVTDPTGAPIALVDRSGAELWTSDADEWGRERATAGAPSVRHAGQVGDEETGLHYARHRYYDPEAKRFLSRDPIELSGGANVFACVPSPLSWIDPLGLTHSRRLAPAPAMASRRCAQRTATSSSTRRSQVWSSSSFASREIQRGSRLSIGRSATPSRRRSRQRVTRALLRATPSRSGAVCPHATTAGVR